jgi:hypothetical protein
LNDCPSGACLAREIENGVDKFAQCGFLGCLAEIIKHQPNLVAVLMDRTNDRVVESYNSLLKTDLHTWLSQQHHGLRTFRTFQQKLETLGRDDPAQRGLCRLLSGLVGSYVEAFDEAPLPVEIADGAYQRLLTLVASNDPNADANRRLADINRVAESELWR